MITFVRIWVITIWRTCLCLPLRGCNRQRREREHIRQMAAITGIPTMTRKFPRRGSFGAMSISAIRWRAGGRCPVCIICRLMGRWLRQSKGCWEMKSSGREAFLFWAWRRIRCRRFAIGESIPTRNTMRMSFVWTVWRRKKRHRFWKLIRRSLLPWQ